MFAILLRQSWHFCNSNIEIHLELIYENIYEQQTSR